MGIPILAAICWPDIAILIVVLIGMVTWLPFRRLARKANLAWADGDAARSVELCARLCKPNSFWAVIERLVNPGHNQAVVALRHMSLGEASEAIDWCERGLAATRKPATRTLLLAAKAEALAAMGDLPALDRCLQELKEVHVDGLVPGVSWGLVAAECYVVAGYPERGLAIIAEAARQGMTAPTTMDFYAASYTLAALGRWDAVLHLARYVLEPDSLLDDKSKTSASGSLPPDAVGGDRVRTTDQRIIESHIVGLALDAADRSGRWDLYDRYLRTLPRLAQNNLRLRASSQGYHAIWAAHLGDEDSALRQVAELDALLETMPRDRSQQTTCAVLAARALCLLGRCDQALPRLMTASNAKPGPLCQSLIAARTAECLDALGRGTEAEPYREEARRLATPAWWNHPEPVPAIEEQATVVVNAWTQIADGGSGPVRPQAVHGPIEQVASPLAWAVWILAVLAMFPVSGTLAAFPLLGCALALMTHRQRRPHDRRVGRAGVVLAMLSLASTTFLGYSYVVISARASASAVSPETESPRSASSEEETPDPAAVALGNDEDAAAPTANEAESEVTETDSDTPTRPNWSYSLSVAWQLKILFLVILILSIIPHEVGHGVAALWCGDPTARDHGRLSLNPIRHVSWFGSVFLPLLLILLPGSAVWIGWAKPVPIQFHRFRSPRLGQLAVSLSGVSMNLLLAALAATALTITLAFAEVRYEGGLASGLLDPGTPAEVVGVPSPTAWGWIVDVCRVTLLVNAILVVFNLIPLPPLDGFHLIRSIVPQVIARLLSRLSFLGFTLFLVLVMTGYVAWMMIPAVYLVAPLLLPAYLLGLL